MSFQSIGLKDYGTTLVVPSTNSIPLEVYGDTTVTVIIHTVLYLLLDVTRTLSDVSFLDHGVPPFLTIKPLCWGFVQYKVITHHVHLHNNDSL